ncbi:acyl carrier protein [Amycolatopsis thailandensis]|uniref:Polyketide synthase n=1 Tax=Amycolatopsis thailandensis TaxID=589330 RepID=A0A229S1M9_9PSEU|nr:acyl carrier protein [Amycolatopsis thailandensis]OXM52681.1 polyketide synthase [Amycolatopsis thailandensis]
MSDAELTATSLTAEKIQSWLVERVAHYAMIPAEEIEFDVPLANYGLDSVYAFALCGDIEDTLGLLVEPILLWDVDTVAALTTHLTEMAAA